MRRCGLPARLGLIFLTLLLLAGPVTAASFAPAASVTRLEFAEIFASGLELDLPDTAPAFIDLPMAGPARDAVAKVYRAGLMSGFPGARFRPEEAVTRAQAVSVLLLAADRGPTSPAATIAVRADREGVGAPFSDLPTNHWAAALITRAWQKGLVAGNPGGCFCPDQPVTAWELAQLVHRFLGEDAALRTGLQALIHTDPPIDPKQSAAAIPILLYHHLAPAGSGFDTNHATITPEEFAWQMKYLADQGYKVLNPAQLSSFLAGELRVPKKTVAITFDDGYLSNLQYAYPILQEHRFPAIFHVITATVLEEPQRPYDATRLQSLSWPELRTLSREGLVTVASHADNLHRYVPSGLFKIQRPALVAQIIDPATGHLETDDAHYRRILTDLQASQTRLTKELGHPAAILAYPYGVSDTAARRAAKEAGFSLTFGTKSVLARFGSGLSDVPRLVVDPGISEEKFRRLLQP